MNLLPLLAALALTQAPAATADAPATPDEAYGRAMSLFLDGRFPEAALAFEGVAADPAAPDDVAQRARALAEASRALDARGRFLLRVPPLTPPAPAGQPTPGAPRLDRSGRGELALYATAYGIWTGIAAGVLAESEDPKLYVGLALAGGGGGLALSVLGTRGRPMPDGRTQAIEAAGNWGSLNGGLVAGLLDSSTQGTVAATLGTGVAAIAGTVALTSRRSPSSGDVAVATSGAMWGLVTGGFALALAGDDDPDEKAVLGTLLGATDVGLLTMALAARRIEISRGRSLLIDAGGVVGALAGLSVPFFLESENPRAYGAAGLGGMAAGLGAAVVLTRGWDAEEDVRSEAGPRTFPFVVPAPAGAVGAGGGGVLAGLRGTF